MVSGMPDIETNCPPRSQSGPLGMEREREKSHDDVTRVGVHSGWCGRCISIGPDGNYN